MSIQEIQALSLTVLLKLIREGFPTTAEQENAEYDLQYREDMAVALAKGGDRPVYNPPNP